MGLGLGRVVLALERELLSAGAGCSCCGVGLAYTARAAFPPGSRGGRAHLPTNRAGGGAEP